MTRWLDPQPVDTSALNELRLIPIVAETLIRRGFNTPSSASSFLEPDRTQPQPGTTLPGLDKAVDYIKKSIQANETIGIWGDFDVDGQTATTILVQTLKSMGANVIYHIPVRANESHGVNLTNLKPMIENGTKLIITCDTGISAIKEADYARSHGVDYIITDHHDLPDQLPEASAIVNPKLLPSDHPAAYLPGAGVAYKLAEALIGSSESDINGTSKPQLVIPDALLDLTALGIIADLALLKNECRRLARRGIEVLRITDRLGLRTIAQLAGLDLSQATEESISFNIAPRLNALGRLSDANPAVELFLTQDPARARTLAAKIEELNTKRRLLTDQVYQAAEAQLRADPSLLTQPVILLTHPSWPGGVIGIVASRLVEQYQKATILLTTSDDGVLRGSARSVEGLNITDAIASNKIFLLDYGGHPMAAGLSLLPENLQDFRNALNKTSEKILGDLVSEEPELQIDAWVDFSSLSLDLANSLEGMAPFGPGNPALVFATHGLTLHSERLIGKKSEHRRLIVKDENKIKREVVWWNSTVEEDLESPFSQGNKFDLAYHVRVNTYQGKRELSLELIDYLLTEQAPAEIRSPKLEIHDLRLQPTTSNLSASTLVWAEGPDRSKGKSRFELVRAEEFAILTIPPSPIDLNNAMATVKPKIIYLIALAPSVEPPSNAKGSQTDKFLSYLAGLTKYALMQRGGKVKVSELAVVTAHREITIRLGLEWLAAGGHFLMKGEGDEYILLTEGAIADPYLKIELYTAVRGLLEETDAYRKHFARAEPTSIFKL